jgi:hypothetical protein
MTIASQTRIKKKKQQQQMKRVGMAGFWEYGDKYFVL